MLGGSGILLQRETLRIPSPPCKICVPASLPGCRRRIRLGTGVKGSCRHLSGDYSCSLPWEGKLLPGPSRCGSLVGALQLKNDIKPVLPFLWSHLFGFLGSPFFRSPFFGVLSPLMLSPRRCWLHRTPAVSSVGGSACSAGSPRAALALSCPVSPYGSSPMFEAHGCCWLCSLPPHTTAFFLGLYWSHEGPLCVRGSLPRVMALCVVFQHLFPPLPWLRFPPRRQCPPFTPRHPWRTSRSQRS